MRMGRKGEEDVLTQRLCQVHVLTPLQFDLAGKIVHFDRELKRVKATDACHPEGGPQLASGEQTAFAESHVQGIKERSNGLDRAVFKFED